MFGVVSTGRPAASRILGSNCEVEKTLCLFLTSTRCYEIAPNGTSALRAQTNHDQPVLCVSWVDDGARVLTGGCDNKAKMWTLQVPTLKNFLCFTC